MVSNTSEAPPGFFRDIDQLRDEQVLVTSKRIAKILARARGELVVADVPSGPLPQDFGETARGGFPVRQVASPRVADERRDSDPDLVAA